MLDISHPEVPCLCRRRPELPYSRKRCPYIPFITKDISQMPPIDSLSQLELFLANIYVNLFFLELITYLSKRCFYLLP